MDAWMDGWMHGLMQNTTRHGCSATEKNRMRGCGAVRRAGAGETGSGDEALHLFFSGLEYVITLTCQPRILHAE